MSKKYDFIGERIRKLRVLKRFSQEELGKELNLSKQLISRIEKGKRKVTDDELEKIADFLEVMPKYLLEDGWIENQYKKSYEPQNKWGIDIPQFIDEYIIEQEEHIEHLIEFERYTNIRAIVEDTENIIKAFQAHLKECKEKSKKTQ